MANGIASAALALSLLAASAAPARADARVVSHRVRVDLEPEQRSALMTDDLEVEGEGPLTLVLGRRFAGELRLDPDVPFTTVMLGGSTAELRIDAPPRRLRLGWRASFAPLAGDPERLAAQVAAYVGPEGAFLSGGAGWYPRGRDDHAPVTVEVAAGDRAWEAVCEGRRDPTAAACTWVCERPFEPLTLVAGPWRRVARDHDGVSLEAYFYEEDLDLAPGYLDAVAGYLDRYAARFGPYPFPTFAVVEHFLPTGYGFPGFTLLGRRVVRLPFIVATSLRHELVHCWWGNGVLVGDGGNWCEALTTFCADMAASEEQGPARARDHRWDLLADYGTYARFGREVALTGFRARHDGATRAVGYAKGAMVFHELRRWIGADAFDAALRALASDRLGQETTWADLRAAFERSSGTSLGWFFEQRVARPGAPALALEHAQLEGGRLALTLSARDGAAWRALLPVEVEDEAGRAWTRDLDVSLPATATITVGLPAGVDARRVRVDPGFEVLRRLAGAELPVSLRRVLGAERPIVVLPAPQDPLAAAYRALAPDLARRLGAELVEPGAARLRDGALVLGEAGPLAATARARLAAGVAIGPDRLTVPTGAVDGPGGCLIACVPTDDGGVAALVVARSVDALAAATRLVHYGREGWVLFDRGRAVARGRADPGPGPLSAELRR